VRWESAGPEYFIPYCRITGISTRNISGRRFARIGSRVPVSLDNFLIIRVISGAVAGIKLCNLGVEGLSGWLKIGHRLSSVELSKVESELLILANLVTKKLLKVANGVFASVNFRRVSFFARASTLSTSK